MPNLTDELSTAKEGPLNQFGTAVSVKCGKSSTESVELLSNLTLTRHTVRRLNQMSLQGRFKVELIQFGSAREKYGVLKRPELFNKSPSVCRNHWYQVVEYGVPQNSLVGPRVFSTDFC